MDGMILLLYNVIIVRIQNLNTKGIPATYKNYSCKVAASIADLEAHWIPNVEFETQLLWTDFLSG